MESLAGCSVAAGAFCVYLLTLLPTVGYNDSGELATAAYGLGVAHPTGYPLFTLMGRAFALLPLGGSVIWKLNLLGALLCAASVFLFYRLFQRLLSARIPSKGAAWAAAAGAVALAFSATVWSEAAVSLEVYALHLVFIPLFSLLLLKALRRPDDARAWGLFAYALGLSFAHHLMTVLMAPAFLYAFFRAYGLRRPAWERLRAAVPPVALGLSAYLYLPVRARVHPVANWGDPSSLQAFWRHVTGAQFRDVMLSSGEGALWRLGVFWAELPAVFGYAPLALAAIGVFASRRFRDALPFVLLLFLACLFYAVQYDIPDFRVYFLQAHAAVAACVALGAGSLLGFARGAWRWPARAGMMAMALAPLFLNYGSADRSRDRAVEEYARNVLASMDSGGMLFTNEYWIINSPVDYLQQVEKVRVDVAVLDIGLFGHDWFYDQLETRHPRLVRDSRPAIMALRGEIAKARAGRPDTSAYAARLSAMFLDLVEKGRARGPVYVTSGINPAMLANYRLVPSGLVFRLDAPEDSAATPPARRFAFAPLPDAEANPMSPIIRDAYAEGYANQGVYLLGLGDTARGVELLRAALAIQPDFPAVRELLGLAPRP